MRSPAGGRAHVAGAAVVAVSILAGVGLVASLVAWAFAGSGSAGWPLGSPARAAASSRAGQPTGSSPTASPTPRSSSSRHAGHKPHRSAHQPAPPGPGVPGGNAVFTAGIRVGVAGDKVASFDAGVSRASMAVSYVPWETPVRWLARLIRAEAWRHAEPIFELYPGPSARDATQIAAGTGDRWLRSLGYAIAGDRRHIVVSFFPEMNGPWRAAWSQGPANYIRAYRHVHAVLGGIAGSLITWAWQPSAMHNANPNPMPWWPGTGYVNLVSLDGYYYFSHDSFTAIFAATLRLVRRTAPKLPIMVGETAAGPMYGRQAWEINNLFAGVRSYGLLGFVWFNHPQHFAPYNFHQDWRLEDHATALAAFRSCVARYGPVAQYLR